MIFLILTTDAQRADVAEVIIDLFPSDIFREHGFIKLTTSSLLLRSDRDIEYWKKFLEDKKCGHYIITEISLSKNKITGRADSTTWNWITSNKQEIITCADSSFIRCEEK